MCTIHHFSVSLLFTHTQKDMRSVFEVIRVTEIDETDVMISSVTSSSHSRVYVGMNNGTLMVYALRHRDGDVRVRVEKTTKRRRIRLTYQHNNTEQV